VLCIAASRKEAAVPYLVEEMLVLLLRPNEMVLLMLEFDGWMLNQMYHAL